MEHALSPIFSNLAKACEKQFKAREAELLWKMAEYFDHENHGKNLVHDSGANGVSTGAPDDFARLAESFEKDETEFLAEARQSAEIAGDRGALRMVTWAGKVNAIQKSIAERYAKKGDALLEGKSLFVCEACGFMFIGDAQPDVCPVCKAPAFRFARIG